MGMQVNEGDMIMEISWDLPSFNFLSKSFAHSRLVTTMRNKLLTKSIRGDRSLARIFALTALVLNYNVHQNHVEAVLKHRYVSRTPRFLFQ